MKILVEFDTSYTTREDAEKEVQHHLDYLRLSGVTILPEATPGKALSEREFSEWLNDNRMADVSSVFHEIVVQYRAALSHREDTVRTLRDILAQHIQRVEELEKQLYAANLKQDRR